jgi:predicted transcriptional regulator
MAVTLPFFPPILFIMSDQPIHPPELVRDLMTVGVATCPPDTLVVDLARLILEKDLETVVVMSEGQAVGVVGQEELVKAYARSDYDLLQVEQIMREEVPQVPADIPLKTAAQIMLDQGVRSLFLMHHAGGVEYPAGVITFRHLIRHLGARDLKDLLDLGITAQRQSPLENFIQRREEARRKARRGE